MSAANVPEPMTPPDCDLRGYEYMPLFGHRLFSSRLNEEATDEEFRACVTLWWNAWQNCPTGSLSSSDTALAKAAGYGKDVRSWLKVKAMVMHGFVQCSDGRLYHPLISEAAVKAYDGKLKAGKTREADRERLRKWRLNRDEKRKATLAEVHNATHDETSSETQCETVSETRFVTPESAVRDEGKVKEGKEDEKVSRKDDRSLRSLAQIAPKIEPFDVWWDGYPRKVGKDKAKLAYAKAVKRGVTHDTLLWAIGRQSWHADPKLIPYPATWLNEGRWQDDPDAAAPKPSNGWDQAASEFFDFTQPTIEHEGNA